MSTSKSNRKLMDSQNASENQGYRFATRHSTHECRVSYDESEAIEARESHDFTFQQVTLRGKTQKKG